MNNSNTIKTICVYCGSNFGNDPSYQEAAKALGELLAARQIRLVYGGAKVGLMGVVADASLSQGGEVIGVIPQALVDYEVAHQGLTDLIITDSMHSRKMKMAELADGFIALPGGWGTLDELFEVLTWAQLGFHQKPCGLLNIAGYYQALEQFLKHTVEAGFVRAHHLQMLLVAEQPAALLDQFNQYQAPQSSKWITTPKQL